MDFHQVTAQSINDLKETSTSFLALWYFKLLLRCKIVTQNIWFFNECLKNDIFPKYIKLKTNNKSEAAKQGCQAGMKKWLIKEKRIQYRKRDIYNIYLKVIHTELAYRLNPIIFDNVDIKVRTQVNEIINKKYKKQKRKISSLLKNKQNSKPKNSFTDHKFYSRFVNLSNTNFTKNEISTLEKGFKHNVKIDINKNNLEYLGVETEIALSDQPNTLDKHLAAKIIKESFKKVNRAPQNQNYNTIKRIKNKTTNDDTIFTKADKGNTVIAINKTDYTQKTNNFLETGKYKKLNKDPTNLYQKEIKSAIENSPGTIKPYEKYKLTIMNPQAPKLYSLVKLHKENFPIRPVVSFITAPSFKISHKLIDLIKENIKFTPKYSVSNSYNLIDKIKNVRLPGNTKLISFDVQNLFPSIPPKDTIHLVENLLDKNNTNIVIKQEILNLLTICLNHNYFQFNNSFYTSNEGLIMGNPLSPLLSEIFMDHLEQEIHKHEYSNKFLYWYRYVDDILAGFTGTTRQLNKFLNNINSLHPNIKFTLEIETKNSINFLDLTIKKVNNQHEFSIFHKPSHTDTTIHNTSNHPYQHKIAAYNSMIHRLLNVPLSKENYNKELQIIKQIAVNNGYNPEIIDKIIAKKSFNKAIQEVYPIIRETNTKFKVLTYLGSPTQIITSFLNKRNNKVAYRTNNTLGKHLKNAKDKTSKENKSGVYELTCGTCPKVYIGQTGRNFGKRISEHKRSFNNKKSDSTYASHLIEENHDFNDNFKILHIEKKGLKLNLLESLEINKMKQSDIILNDQLDTNASPLLNLFRNSS